MEKETELRSLTFGERLVGITFNPSKITNVYSIKKLCANVADIIEHENTKDHDMRAKSRIEELLYTKALSDLLTAQMSAVKCLTFGEEQEDVDIETLDQHFRKYGTPVECPDVTGK